MESVVADISISPKIGERECRGIQPLCIRPGRVVLKCSFQELIWPLPARRICTTNCYTIERPIDASRNIQRLTSREPIDSRHMPSCHEHPQRLVRELRCLRECGEVKYIATIRAAISAIEFPLARLHIRLIGRKLQ